MLKLVGRSIAVMAMMVMSLQVSAAPGWWTTRGVLVPGATPNDYAAVNLGQVKRIARGAYDELQARLPGGAGSTLTALVNSWAQPPPAGVVRNDYAVVNIGQLKALAKLFYDRLAAAGYHGTPLAAGQIYPWTATTVDDNDYVAANIGQVKFLFSFDFGPATVTLGALEQSYDGSSHPVTVVTSPDGLAVSVTYNGSSSVPANAGSYAVSATITDPSYFGGATGTLIITKAAASVTWNPPDPIVYGTALGGAQLNATASVTGSFSYSPATGAVLNAGSQLLSVTFIPADSTNYETATRSVTLLVNKAVPALVWLAPAAITYGTPLGGAQLNASAPTSGSFVYTPGAGTVLTTGPQALSVVFTPADAANHEPASATVPITVNKAPAVVALTALMMTADGAPKPVTVTTTPANLPVAVTYNGSAEAPTAAGTYPNVVATVTSPYYQGTATGTLTISPPLPSAYVLVLALPDSSYLGVKPDLTVETTSAPP